MTSPLEWDWSPLEWNWSWSKVPQPEHPAELLQLDTHGAHVGAGVQLFTPDTADRRGTVEATSGRRVRDNRRGGRGRHTYLHSEPRNGLPVLARYEYRRGGRITPLTARILAEIGAEREA